MTFPELERRLPKPVPEDLAAQIVQIRGYRATYVQVVERALAADQAAVDVDLVKRALATLDGLEDELRDANTDEERKNIVDRAEEVAQGRAYVQPTAELALEAKTLVDDLANWGIPAEFLASIDRELLQVITRPRDPEDSAAQLREQRAALNKLYQYYDAWSEHVVAYERWSKTNAWSLGALLIASSIICVAAIHHRQPLLGFMTAGLTGALLSVLSKLPPMLSWGQWASYTPRMLGRITTGIAATLAGGALLALDVIQVGSENFDALFEVRSPSHVLLLVGLGISFGFSERALVKFHELVFQPDKTPAKG